MAKKKRRVPLTDSLLPETRPRFDIFAAAFIFQCFLATVLAIIPMIIPQAMQLLPRYWVTPIETPMTLPRKPQTKKVIRPATFAPEPSIDPVEDEATSNPRPKITLPAPSSPVLRPVNERTKPDAPEVGANILGDSKIPMLGTTPITQLKKPREEVQVGAFGDPNGLSPNGIQKRSPNVAQLGTNNLPSAAGRGNSADGVGRPPAAMAGGGFTGGVGSGNRVGGRGAVRQGMFSDGTAAVSRPKAKPVASTTARTIPVEILYKPRPEYTKEARDKKIEGDVLLEVVFQSTGEVRVVRVVGRLGYGLDESAEAAAHKIRFRPAEREGEKVDFPSTVHITFSLAY